MPPSEDAGVDRPSDGPNPSAGTGVRVIYIAGSGRSGSTVLATLLGGHPDLVSVGELERLPTDAWIENQYCACGRRADACGFWSAVRERWADVIPDVEPSQLVKLQRRFTRRGSLPRLLLPPRTRGRRFRRFETTTAALLRAIAGEAGVDGIVDSSKSPVRALALARMEAVDLRVIHLVRDGRGVLASLRKGYRKDVQGGIPHDIPPRPTWRVAALWTFSNLVSEALRGVVGRERYVRVRYEDLMRDPPGALASLEGVVGHRLASVGERAARGEAFSTGHTIAGNRVRMQGEVRLRSRGSWRDGLEDRDRRLFRLLAGPVMRRYGYGQEG